MSMDLFDLLGGEWATLGKPAERERIDDADLPGMRDCSCPRDEKTARTHGCAESGIAPTHWDDAFGGYVDGMGRPSGCAYCFSCVSSGRTSLRDPWTDELIDWAGAPCAACWGTGYHHHAWDCGPERDHAHLTAWPQVQKIERFGVTFDGRVFVPGERSPWADLSARSLVEAAS